MSTQNSSKKIRYEINDTVKSRLYQFKDYLGVTTRSFEMSIGVANGYLRQLKKTPTFVTLEKIYTAYPDLNPIWLLKGAGSMLKCGESGNSSTSVLEISQSNVFSDNSVAGAGADAEMLKMEIKRLSESVAQKDEQIEYFKEQIRELMQSLKAKDNLIEKLSSR